jgi:hypothetical protein
VTPMTSSFPAKCIIPRQRVSPPRPAVTNVLLEKEHRWHNIPRIAKQHQHQHQQTQGEEERIMLVQGILVSLWSIVSLAILVPREDIELSVPLSGNLSNSSTHYDPVTWTLYNPVFNQTTWEAQPYVLSPNCGSKCRCLTATSDTVFQQKEWDTGSHPTSKLIQETAVTDGLYSRPVSQPP